MTALTALTSTPVHAQGIPDWAPVPTFDVVRDHTENATRPWLHPYSLDVLAPRDQNGMAGPQDGVPLTCSYHAGGATFATVDGRAN